MVVSAGWYVLHERKFCLFRNLRCANLKELWVYLSRKIINMKSFNSSCHLPYFLQLVPLQRNNTMFGLFFHPSPWRFHRPLIWTGSWFKKEKEIETETDFDHVIYDDAKQEISHGLPFPVRSPCCEVGVNLSYW